MRSSTKLRTAVNAPTDIRESGDRVIFTVRKTRSFPLSFAPFTTRMSRNDLLQLLATRSAKRGTFTLASGRQSSLYIDARLTSMSPEGLALIGPGVLAAMRDARWDVDAVGGLTLGADPIAYAASYASASSSHPIRAFTVRKEAKTHGTGKLI